MDFKITGNSVEAPRIWLHPFSMQYLDGLCALDQNPTVMLYLNGGTPRTVEETTESIQRVEKRWQELGCSWWVSVDKETDAVIGSACLQPLAHIAGAELEIGWRLLPEHNGKGFATEAGQAAIHFAAHKMGVDHVAAVADPKNTASTNVMERLGMTYAGVERHYDFDCAIYRLHGIKALTGAI